MNTLVPSKVCVIAAAIATSGCSGLTGRQIAGEYDAKSEPPVSQGTTYYLSKPVFRIDLLATAGGKEAIPEYRAVVGYTADKEHRYEVGLNPGLFTSDTFELNLTEDGRLAGLNASITDTSPEHIKTLGQLVVSGLGAAALSDPATHLEDALTYAVSQTVITAAQKTDLIKVRDELKMKDPAKPTRDELISAERLLPIAETAVGRQWSEFQGAPINTEDQPTFDKQVRISKQWEAVAELKAAVQARLRPSLAAYIKEKKQAVDRALTRAITEPGQEATDELAAALDAYKAIVKTIVKADEVLDDRKLGERREVLLAFLKRAVPDPLPTPDNAANWYSQLRLELDHIDSIIAKLIPAASAPATASGTEVTRTFDDLETIYLPPDFAHKHKLVDLLALGRAYWLYGVSAQRKAAGLEGVVLYFRPLPKAKAAPNVAPGPAPSGPQAPTPPAGPQAPAIPNRPDNTTDSQPVKPENKQ